MVEALLKFLGVSPAVIKESLEKFKEIERDSKEKKKMFQDEVILLQDILDVDKQILAELKKRGKK